MTEFDSSKNNYGLVRRARFALFLYTEKNVFLHLAKNRKFHEKSAGHRNGTFSLRSSRPF